MKRAIMLALSAILALVVAAPIASGQSSSQSIEELTAEWWNWTASQDPSPLVGNYNGGDQCDGEYVDGVFFLAGTLGGDASRTCTVPAHMPILLPTFNVVCSEAYGLAGQTPPDDEPYDTACATPITDFVLANGDTYATLKAKDSKEIDDVELAAIRIASGLFDWNIQFENNPFEVHLENEDVNKLPEGTWESATDGEWVYLADGLDTGEYTLEFGGTFFDDKVNFNTTYDLVVK